VHVLTPARRQQKGGLEGEFASFASGATDEQYDFDTGVDRGKHLPINLCAEKRRPALFRAWKGPTRGSHRQTGKRLIPTKVTQEGNIVYEAGKDPKLPVKPMRGVGVESIRSLKAFNVTGDISGTLYYLLAIIQKPD